MADFSAPLITKSLSQSLITTDRSISPTKHSSPLEDKIEEYIGDLNCTQFLQAFLVSFAWAFDAQQAFISIFADAKPQWHCINQLTGTPVHCNSSTDICNSPVGNISWAWNNPKYTSSISDFDLQCSTSFIKSLPASSFYLGCVIGGFFLPTLADSWLGRKKILVFSCLSMSICGILTAVSPEVCTYSALRLASGIGRAALGTCSLVLSTELVGKRWRGTMGIMGFVCFGVGFCSLPVIAYVNRNYSWKYLHIWISAPSLIYSILVYIFVEESPRWLFVRGRREEAVQTLLKLSGSQDNIASRFFHTNKDKELQECSDEMGLYSAIRMLVGSRWSLKRLASVMAISFGIGMVYYGAPLGVGNFNFNLYLSVTLNAIAELLASIITFFLVEKLKRKRTLVFLTFLSGACSLLVAAAGSKLINIQVGLEAVSFLSGVTALNVTFIFIIELFPTCVRNSALATARQAVVFGGVFSPMLVAVGKKDAFLTYGLFGIEIALCGFVVTTLPETRGTMLCDTMEQEEHKESKNIAPAN